MRNFLKKLFSRSPTQQLGLETDPNIAYEDDDDDDDDDYSWLSPPDSLTDPAPWDNYWYQHISHGVAGFVHLFCNDGHLVDTMRANGLKTVLCVGNGISLEPRALAWAGFDVTVLDLSPFAMKLLNDEANPPEELLAQLVGGRSGGVSGNLSVSVGDLCDPKCCPGPFDVIVERRTLQLYRGESRPLAVKAVADRLASPGIFFSQAHNGGWKPPEPRVHPLEVWFRAEGWPVEFGKEPAATRVAWLSTTTG